MNIRKKLQSQASNSSDGPCNDACHKTLQLLKNIIIQRAQSEVKLQNENNQVIRDLDTAQQNAEAIKQAIRWKCQYEKQLQFNRQLQRKLNSLKASTNIKRFAQDNQLKNGLFNPEQYSQHQSYNHADDQSYDFQTEYKQLLQKKVNQQKVMRKKNKVTSINTKKRFDQRIQNAIKEKLGCNNYLQSNVNRNSQIVIKIVNEHMSRKQKK